MDFEITGSVRAKGVIAVVMGVSGSGKTLLGEALARSIGGRFIEGDDYHPPANIRRMASGQPLRDEDRWGWLDAIAVEIAAADQSDATLVVACSALKRAYRDRLRGASELIVFIYLEVSRDTAAARVAARRGHFMPPSLIDSQFAALEPPSSDEQALHLDAALEPARLSELALAAVGGSLARAATRSM